MISLQTNVTSLFAQQQLETNDNFESNTIEQLTSGYRINSAGDDAAGLAVANQLQANVTELQQGVINAANGTSAFSRRGQFAASRGPLLCRGLAAVAAAELRHRAGTPWHPY